MIFKRREDAENAVAQFHKRTLDGTPMHVEIVEGGGTAESARGGVRGRGGGGGGGGAPTWRGARVRVFFLFFVRGTARADEGIDASLVCVCMCLYLRFASTAFNRLTNEQSAECVFAGCVSIYY